MIDTNVVIHTDGSGYWSVHKRGVRVVGYELAYVNDEADFGELRVYFDEDTWDIADHGLIYTDQRFIAELREWLASQGLDAADVAYSEQGMQGEDYVSLDVDGAFISSFMQLEAVS